MMTARDDGKSPDHAIAQARVLADRGDYAGACALCEDGLARAALDYDGHLLHAQICQELGNREAARKALRRSLYLRPDSVAAHFLLGNLYESDGEHESARRCMRNVVDLAVASSEDRSEADETDGDAQRLLEAAKAFLQTRHSERRGRHADVKHG